jgi:hypothetical protein
MELLDAHRLLNAADAAAVADVAAVAEAQLATGAAVADAALLRADKDGRERLLAATMAQLQKQVRRVVFNVLYVMCVLYL